MDAGDALRVDREGGGAEGDAVEEQRRDQRVVDLLDVLDAVDEDGALQVGAHFLAAELVPVLEAGVLEHKESGWTAVGEFLFFVCLFVL